MGATRLRSVASESARKLIWFTVLKPSSGRPAGAELARRSDYGAWHSHRAISIKQSIVIPFLMLGFWDQCVMPYRRDFPATARI